MSMETSMVRLVPEARVMATVVVAAVLVASEAFCACQATSPVTSSTEPPAAAASEISLVCPATLPAISWTDQVAVAAAAAVPRAVVAAVVASEQVDMLTSAWVSSDRLGPLK